MFPLRFGEQQFWGACWGLWGTDGGEGLAARRTAPPPGAPGWGGGLPRRGRRGPAPAPFTYYLAEAQGGVAHLGHFVEGVGEEAA